MSRKPASNDPLDDGISKSKNQGHGDSHVHGTAHSRGTPTSLPNRDSASPIWPIVNMDEDNEAHKNKNRLAREDAKRTHMTKQSHGAPYFQHNRASASDLVDGGHGQIAGAERGEGEDHDNRFHHLDESEPHQPPNYDFFVPSPSPPPMPALPPPLPHLASQQGSHNWNRWEWYHQPPLGASHHAHHQDHYWHHQQRQQHQQANSGYGLSFDTSNRGHFEDSEPKQSWHAAAQSEGDQFGSPPQSSRSWYAVRPGMTSAHGSTSVSAMGETTTKREPASTASAGTSVVSANSTPPIKTAAREHHAGYGWQPSTPDQFNAYYRQHYHHYHQHHQYYHPYDHRSVDPPVFHADSNAQKAYSAPAKTTGSRDPRDRARVRYNLTSRFPDDNLSPMRRQEDDERHGRDVQASNQHHHRPRQQQQQQPSTERDHPSTKVKVEPAASVSSPGSHVTTASAELEFEDFGPSRRRAPATFQKLYNTNAAASLIQTVRKSDILCGRGAPVHTHPGNDAFRDLVQQHQAEYVCAKRSDKPHIATLILEEIKGQGGRFLRRPRDSKHSGVAQKAWEEVDEYNAYEKVCQALREGAPEIRRRMMQSSHATSSLGGASGSNSKGRSRNNSRSRDKENAKNYDHGGSAKGNRRAL